MTSSRDSRWKKNVDHAPFDVRFCFLPVTANLFLSTQWQIEPEFKTKHDDVGSSLEIITEEITGRLILELIDIHEGFYRLWWNGHNFFMLEQDALGAWLYPDGAQNRLVYEQKRRVTIFFRVWTFISNEPESSSSRRWTPVPAQRVTEKWIPFNSAILRRVEIFYHLDNRIWLVSWISFFWLRHWTVLRFLLTCLLKM